VCLETPAVEPSSGSGPKKNMEEKDPTERDQGIFFVCLFDRPS